MDPKETVLSMLVALASNERAEAQDHADNLADWLSKDGFTPAIDYQFLDELTRRLQDVRKTTQHVVVQLGGSSTEWYTSSYDSREEAIEAIIGHYDATYSAIGPFEIPDPPREGDWISLTEEIASAAARHDLADYNALKQELGADGEEESSEEESTGD